MLSEHFDTPKIGWQAVLQIGKKHFGESDLQFGRILPATIFFQYTHGREQQAHSQARRAIYDGGLTALR